MQWQRDSHRDYLYVGEGRGADIAAWRQLLRAEAAMLQRTQYGHLLFDLVKAFERIRHWLLVREAHELGYPMWLIRLSIATYRMPRVIRIGSVVSHTVVATRGIIAGSGTADCEMRLALIRFVDKAVALYSEVAPHALRR